MKPVTSGFGWLRYFVWIIVPILLYAMFKAWGIPHLAFNYTYMDDGRGYEPFAPSRWYTSCTYIGYYGHFHFDAQNGTCPWLKFYKADGKGKL
jgi:hypothetical protein